MKTIIEKLIALGFIDKSHDKNGLAYRKALPGDMLEICYYILDQYVRIQTIRSGFTFELKGVKTPEDLISLWKLLTDEDLTE